MKVDRGFVITTGILSMTAARRRRSVFKSGSVLWKKMIWITRLCVTTGCLLKMYGRNLQVALDARCGFHSGISNA